MSTHLPQCAGVYRRDTQGAMPRPHSEPQREQVIPPESGYMTAAGTEHERWFDQRRSRRPVASRLLSAAVTSPRFTRTLLATPALALEIGVADGPINCTVDERRAIAAVRADSLQEFALALAAVLPSA